MATAQEILAKIKENKRKENEKLFKLAETSSNWNSNNLYSSTTNGSVHRLSTVSYTYEQEYKLYINLVVYYILHPSIIPPLHPYQKMLQKIVPRVHKKLYPCTHYGTVALHKHLFNFIISNSTCHEDYSKVNNTLLASLREDTLSDIWIALKTLKEI